MTKKSTCTLVKRTPTCRMQVIFNFTGDPFDFSGVEQFKVTIPKSHHLMQRVYENGDVEFILKKTRK